VETFAGKPAESDFRWSTATALRSGLCTGDIIAGTEGAVVPPKLRGPMTSPGADKSGIAAVSTRRRAF